METKKKNKIGATQYIALGFLITILLGTFLLKLPISHVGTLSTFDALFVATSATCVTGLSTVVVADTFTIFGQFIIMCLIQIGGLGFMLIIALALMLLGKKITLKNRILISQSVNSNSLEGLVKLTRKVLKYTFTFEIIGALFIAFVYVPIYGWGAGLFKSLFQSISAFCNAGFDVIGPNNMVPFVTNKIVNITCMVLTTIAGLGFLVWDDISKVITQSIKEKYTLSKIFQKLSLHTKIVLMMHLLLFTIGTTVFLVFEYHNPGTIARFDFQDKLMISAFHSVAARTSGFASVNLSNLTDMTKLVMTILMLIGAGSGSMAGGIKTTTLFVVMVGVWSHVIGNKNMNVGKRTIPNETFVKAVTVLMIAIGLLLVSNLFLIAHSHIRTLDLFFESVSAFATVGLTSGALAQMNVICQGWMVLLMYIGRIGTITMALAFVMKKPKENDLIVYAKEDVIVG